MTLRALALLACLLAAPFAARTQPSAAPAPSPAPAPALWVVHGPHATVYLFGTVHALRPTQAWRSPKIDQAFAASGALWEEIGDEDPQSMYALVAKLGGDPAHPLSTKLSPTDLARVDAAAKSAGMARGEAQLEPMRPWMAGVTLGLLPLTRAGYDPEAGVDKRLRADARAAGKPLRAFETMEEQLHFFADLSPAQEVGFLRASLDDIADGPAKLDEMVAAWAHGDVDALARLETDELRHEAPDLYESLIVRRNAAWAARLAGELRGSGTIFVAVGAGHLAGPDSLQRQLQKLGFRVERR